MTAVNQIIPVFIPHLGCPHDCVFCNQKRISGSLLPACPEDVTRALETGLERCSRPPELAFYGGSFTAIPVAEQEALLNAAAPYIALGRLRAIRLSTRPDAISWDILRLLISHGVSTVELGAQSMDDRVLYESGRGHRAEDTVRAAEMIKKSGLKLVLQMMTGLPGSDAASDVETAERIAALEPDGVRIYPTVIIRDTELFDMWRRGEYREHTVEDAVSVCAEILPIFRRAGIPVIRLGLNPTDDLTNGDAVAGAYHPALGELVISRIMLQKAQKLMEERGADLGTEATLGVHRSRVSAMVGQHRQNKAALTAQFGLRRLKIVACDAEPDEIKLF